MTNASLRRKALQMLLLCTSFWALSFPAMKALMLMQQNMLPGAGTWFITALCVMLRFLLGGALLALLRLPKLKSISRREVEQGLWLGVIVSAGLCFQMDALAYTSASTAAFLTQLYSVFIPIWVAVTRRRFPAPKIVLCIALVLLGMALLVNLNIRAIRLGRGELETVAASILFTAQILCVEHPRYAANKAPGFTVVMLLTSGVLTAPLVMATAPGVAECVRLYQTLPALALLLVLSLVCGVAPFLLMNRWQREVSATEAGLVYCGEPVLVSLLALFLPAWLSHWTGVNYANEQLTHRLLLGGGLVTVANLLLQSPWLEAGRGWRPSTNPVP